MSQEVWSDSMRSQVESAFYYTLFNSVTAKFAGQCGMVKVTHFTGLNKDTDRLVWGPISFGPWSLDLSLPDFLLSESYFDI